MAAFSRRVKGFQDVFPSSRAEFTQPTDVSETVQLTHPFLAAGTRFDEMQTERVLGTLGVAFANFPIVPADRYWYVPWWHIRHNDPAAKRLEWFLEEKNFGNLVVIHSTIQEGNGAVIAANIDVGAPRPVLVPPGWRIVAGAAGIAAGQFITTICGRIEYPLAEQPPPY